MAANANIITVMFTDMVASTNITQGRDHGDSRTQVLMVAWEWGGGPQRAIVRKALAEFGGCEVMYNR